MKQMARLLFVVLAVLTSLARTYAAAPAFDSAADPSYDSGWFQGANGGYGFASLGYSATDGNAGVFLGDSSGNGNAPSGDINTSGRAWGLYASSGGLSQAGRAFTTGGPNNSNTLAPGQVFSIQSDTGFVDSSTNGEVGLNVGSNVGANFQFNFYGGNGVYTFNAHNSYGVVYSGIPYTNNGLTLSLVLGYNGNFTLIVTINGGSTYTINDSFGGDPHVYYMGVYNMHAGSDSSHDFFFNNMSIANVPVATGIDSSSSGGVTVHFNADAHRTYRLQRKANLNDTSWQSVDGVADLTTSGSGAALLTDPNGTSADHAFYRVGLLLP
jgi:hypothetical protein